ncbi:MAG TPA: hypothetical protein VJ951_08000 [Bacteroidales bacterium]|nr:hypothetical protein [Bacteroidales bacterium]
MLVAVYQLAGRKEAVVVDNNGQSTHSREEIDKLDMKCFKKDIINDYMGDDGGILDGPHQLEPLIVSYDYSKCYGGPEEGGWYYDMLSNPMVVDQHVEVNQDPTLPENHRTYQEYIVGENETTERPVYC